MCNHRIFLFVHDIVSKLTILVEQQKMIARHYGTIAKKKPKATTHLSLRRHKPVATQLETLWEHSAPQISVTGNRDVIVTEGTTEGLSSSLSGEKERKREFLRYDSFQRLNLATFRRAKGERSEQEEERSVSWEEQQQQQEKTIEGHLNVDIIERKHKRTNSTGGASRSCKFYLPLLSLSLSLSLSVCVCVCAWVRAM